MNIKTKFSLGDRVGFKKRGPVNGYLFMVGPVTGIAINVDADGSIDVRYRMEFEDVSKRSGWRNWFGEDEVESVKEG